MSKRERPPVDIDIPDYSAESVQLHQCDAGAGGDPGAREARVVHNVGGTHSINVQGGTAIFNAPVTFVNYSHINGDVDALTENQRRWLIVGICLNGVVTPALRTYVAPVFQQLYDRLVHDESIHTQTHAAHLIEYPAGNHEKLNYEPINNNVFQNQKADYDYAVQNDVDLSKLFLRTIMAFHSGFDNTCDTSALLTFLIKVDDFGIASRNAAQLVKDEVRNPWGHCNFDDWTCEKYNESFDWMADLLNSLNLPVHTKAGCLADLNKWKTNGESFLSGSTVGFEVVQSLTSQVKQLQVHVQRLAEQTRVEVLEDIESIQNIEDKFDDITSTLSRFQNELSDLGNRVTVQEFVTKDHEKRLSILEQKNDQSIRNKFFIVPGSKRTFIGRQEYLDKMEQLLLREPPDDAQLQIDRKIVLCGLGGVGKTSIAMEYIWRNHEEHYKGGVFWISGENEEAYLNAIRLIGSRIGTLRKESDETEATTLNYISLRSNRCLLVLDNVDEEILASQILRFVKNRSFFDFHHLIVTTRREPVKAELDFDCNRDMCVDIRVLSDDEAYTFVQTILDSTGIIYDRNIPTLCERLQHLPLALEQAASKIKQIRCSINDYLEEFDRRRLQVLDNPIDRQSVMTTWTMNIESIVNKAEQSGLGDVVNILLPMVAYLSKDDINLAIFNQGLPEHDNQNLRETLISNFQKRNVLALFTEFSILRADDADVFRIHALVQDAIRNRFNLDDSRLHQVAKCALAMLKKTVADSPTNTGLLLTIDRHCSSILQHFEQFEDIRTEAEDLQNGAFSSAQREVALALSRIGDYYIQQLADNFEKTSAIAALYSGISRWFGTTMIFSLFREDTLRPDFYVVMLLSFGGAFLFTQMMNNR